MSHKYLQSKERIYESIRSNLVGRIAKLTNFTDRSFNYVWTQAFSEEVRELQEFAVVSEMAGFVDYAGGPIDEDDLEALGYDDLITAERVNELMDENYLDEYVKIVGVNRNDGSPASGTVTFTTQSADTTIPSGTRVTTAPQADGTTTDFLTTESASTGSNVTSVSAVPIESVDEGKEFNVPANTITRISNPPVGVTGVTNPESTTGGEDEETNDELRARAKSAVGGASEGGTVEGIKAYIRNNVDGIQTGDIIIDEFTDEQPPFVDVIVDGGLDTEVSDAIEFSRPAGITHNLVRPQVVQIGVFTDLVGTDIDTTTVDNVMTDFLLELGIGNEFYQDQFIREIMQADDDIININFLDTTIERVTNETFEYTTEISHALADDGGSFTDETTEANNAEADDVTLLPASPVVGDAYYFGEETIFSELEIKITTAGSGTWDIVWEYYDGSSWVSLSNVNDGTTNFQTQGVNSVNWDIPSDWTSTDVSDTHGKYFVRARLDSFTSLSTQPLAESIDVTGSGYRLDYTYENANGSITVEDQSGDTYTENTDFVVVDNSGDGWPETFVWEGAATPDDSENFFVDYDVTVIGETKNGDKNSADLVRDEVFTFAEGRTDTATYNNTQQVYEMTYVPFESTISVVDENTTTFTEDTDFQLTAPQDYATTDTFTYSAGTTDYALSSDVEIDFVAIHDENNNIYIRGTDYTVIDSDSDGFDDSISWDTNNSFPGDTTEFYVTYDAYPRGIRWDTNDSTPPQDDNFTITYDQVMYESEYEIEETPGGVIRDSSGDLYNEDTEYVLVDSTRDGENDAVYWTTNPASLGAGEQFFFSYFNEGDINFGDREKADPGTITVESSE
jgi:hypothetical protein